MKAKATSTLGTLKMPRIPSGDRAVLIRQSTVPLKTAVFCVIKRTAAKSKGCIQRVTAMPIASTQSSDDSALQWLAPNGTLHVPMTMDTNGSAAIPTRDHAGESMGADPVAPLKVGHHCLLGQVIGTQLRRTSHRNLPMDQWSAPRLR